MSKSIEQFNELKKENLHLKEENELLKQKIYSFRENKKNGMIKKASKGELQSRAPFGYSIQKGKLIPSENFQEVEEIFEEFLNTNISLNKIAKRHKFSVNGIKKILTNFTYLGKIKFNNEIHEGHHKPLVSSTLFNHVQNKFERLNKSKFN